MKQAVSYDINNRRVLAWSLDTDQGRKMTWAASAGEARAKVEAKGLKVLAIVPRGGLLDMPLPESRNQ